MINPDCLKEATTFLKEFPQPSIRTASSMRKGFVSCIKPIKTICGAELMCHPDMTSAVRALIRQCAEINTVKHA
jgi:hypothetical protein